MTPDLILVALYVLGVPVGFVVSARAYAAAPPDPLEDDSDLAPLASLVSGLLWPLLGALWLTWWLCGRAYALSIPDEETTEEKL